MSEFLQSGRVQSLAAGAFLVGGLFSGAEAIDRDRDLVTIESMTEADLETRGIDVEAVNLDEIESLARTYRNLSLGSAALNFFVSGFWAAGAVRAPSSSRREQEPQAQKPTKK